MSSFCCSASQTWSCCSYSHWYSQKNTPLSWNPSGLCQHQIWMRPVYSAPVPEKFKVWRQICTCPHHLAVMWKTKSKNICKNIPHNIKPLNFIWWVCTYSCSWGRFLITSLQKYTVIIWPWLIWDQWACSINAESEHSMQLRELQQDHLLLLNDAFIG